MHFDESFLAGVRENPIGSALAICRVSTRTVERNQSGWTEDDRQVLTEAFAIIAEMIDAKLLLPITSYPNLQFVSDEQCVEAHAYFKKLEDHFEAKESASKVEALRSKMRVAIGAGFVYEFTDGDLARLQQLINELRDLISKSTVIPDEHKRRLLARLEKLQSELNKKMSSFDYFWGLAGEAGVAIGKFGNDVKPIVDRIREITQIMWTTQSRAEELPSGTDIPSLGHDKEDE